MRFIKNIFKKFYNWVNSDNNYDEDDVWATPVSIGRKTRKNTTQPDSAGDTEQGFHFTIFSAVGGKVLQLYTYDVNMDRRPSKLYIISDKDDLGAELSHILTMESLSR
jgi:hypothetical protein